MECEIDYSATVHFDFVVRDDKDELLDTLRSLYENVHHEVSRTISPSGVDSENSILFTNPNWNEADQFPVENSGYYDTIFSYVTDVNKSIIGVVTFGMISENEKKNVQQMEKDNARNRVQNHLLNMNPFQNAIPSITDVNFPCDITYLELEDPRLEPQEAKSTEMLHSLWEGCGSELNKYHIYFADSLSALDIGENTYLLTPQVLSQPLGSLSLVNLTSSSDDEGEDSNGLPEWYEVIQMMYPYLKLGEWLGFRREQLQTIEKTLHDILGSVGTYSVDSDELLSMQTRLVDIRNEWITANVQLTDELDEIRSEHSDILTGEADLEFESSPPAPEETIGSTNALIPIWGSNIQNGLDDIESLRTRVSQKHDQTSSYLHNSIMAQSAISNLALQDKITTLTRTLLGLTAVLLLVEIINVQTILQWVTDWINFLI